MSPSSGADAGLQSTPLASHSRLPVLVLWAHATPIICSQTAVMGRSSRQEIERKAVSESPTHGDIRQGFVCERVPHITLRAIANNAEIDVIWQDAQEDLEPLREELNRVLDVSWEEWEIPRDAGGTWPDEVKSLHFQWWERRIARQKEIDASIAANADHEYLYNKPYEDRSKVRVAGPLTVESISPHRVLGVDENGDVIAESSNGYGSEYDFAQVMLDKPENLRRTAGPVERTG